MNRKIVIVVALAALVALSLFAITSQAAEAPAAEACGGHGRMMQQAVEQGIINSEQAGRMNALMQQVDCKCMNRCRAHQGAMPEHCSDATVK